MTVKNGTETRLQLPVARTHILLLHTPTISWSPVCMEQNVPSGSAVGAVQNPLKHEDWKQGGVGHGRFHIPKPPAMHAAALLDGAAAEDEFVAIPDDAVPLLPAIMDAEDDAVMAELAWLLLLATPDDEARAADESGAALLLATADEEEDAPADDEPTA